MIRQKKFCFYAPQKIEYRRPDGSVHKASWFICCEECHHEAGGDPSKIRVRGDGIWDKPGPHPQLLTPGSN